MKGADYSCYYCNAQCNTHSLPLSWSHQVKFTATIAPGLEILVHITLINMQIPVEEPVLAETLHTCTCVNTCTYTIWLDIY